MNPYYLLILIPALPIIGWAIAEKLKQRHWAESLLIGLPALAVLGGAILLPLIIADPQATHLKWLQMLLSATIVPLAYIYFSRQMGRQFNNGTNILLLLLLLILLLPQCVIFWPGEVEAFNPTLARPYSIQIVRHGQIIFSLLTGDFVILAQALLTMMRMIPMARTLRHYGLKFDHKMYAFGLWWAMAVLFIATVSLTDLNALSTTLGSLYYYIGLTLLLITIYLLLALHFDLHPIQTSEGEAVPNIGVYIQQQSGLSAQVRHIVEDDRVYLQPGYRTEDILKALATNRTYFTHTMQEHFGMTFSQYLNEHRLAHAQHLLLTTDLTQSEIALQSGFSNVTYMSRLFHSTYNLTPRQWQIEHTAVTSASTETL